MPLPTQPPSSYFTGSRDRQTTKQETLLRDGLSFGCSTVSLEAAGNRLAELAEDPTAFMVFEFGHKPADRPALRRGERVRKRARLRYAHCSHLDAYLPRFKGANEKSPISRAFRTNKRERGVEALPGSKDSTPFAIEAKAFGSDERRRVLAVATLP